MILLHRRRLAAKQFRPIQLILDFWTWPLLASIALVALVAAPGPIHHAAHDALHGLCAQQPSHSLVVGERYLPFDARMTGIYGGVLIALSWFATHGRLRCWSAPPRTVVVLLVGLVALMGLDGTNSLFMDLRWWHPYQPTNVGRLLTGLGAGVAMATLLAWLFATSVWDRGQAKAAMRSPRELAQIGLICGLYAFVVLMKPGWLFVPVTIMLLGSAWLTVALLMFVMVVLTTRHDGTFADVRQLHIPVLGASVLALGVMLGLAGGRFWLERTLGIVAVT